MGIENKKTNLVIYRNLSKTLYTTSRWCFPTEINAIAVAISAQSMDKFIQYNTI